MNKNRFIGLDDEDDVKQVKNNKSQKGMKHLAKAVDKPAPAPPKPVAAEPKPDDRRRMEKIDATRHLKVAPVRDPSQRLFDRHDGTGRGRDIPKGGEGRGNWGNVKKPYTAEIPRDESAAASKGAVKPEVVEAVPAEPIDTRRTYEEYQAELQQKQLEAAAAAQKNVRKVVVPASLKPLEVKEEDYYAPQKKKDDKKKDDKKKDNKKEEKPKEAKAKAAVAPSDLLGITSKPNRGAERYHRDYLPQRVNKVSEEDFPKLQ